MAEPSRASIGSSRHAEKTDSDRTDRPRPRGPSGRRRGDDERRLRRHADRAGEHEVEGRSVDAVHGRDHQRRAGDRERARAAGGRQGATDTSTGDPIKTLSQTPTQGTCKNDGFGVTCRLGDMPQERRSRLRSLSSRSSATCPISTCRRRSSRRRPRSLTRTRRTTMFELDTEIPKPIKIEGVPNRCTSKKIVLRSGPGSVRLRSRRRSRWTTRCSARAARTA